MAQFMLPVAGDDGSPAEARLAVAGEAEIGAGRQKRAAVGSVRHTVSGSFDVAGVGEGI
ncbi:hypothetical protein ACE1SV_02520 [Streptomyces sp. E-15]